MNNLTFKNTCNIEIAEDNKNYLLAKFIICNFDVNRNKVQINENSDTLERDVSTLVDCPLVGKIKGEDFGSHEAKKVFNIGDNGEIVQSYKFGTEAFGTFIEANIEEINGEKYIVGTTKIWKRFENCCEIIMNKVANNEPIGTSWELSISKQHDENGVKVIDEFTFLGLALLGSKVTQAYPSNDNSLLQVAEEEKIDEFDNAYIKDLINISSITDDNSVKDISNKGGSSMEDNKTIESLTSEMEKLNVNISELNTKISEKDNEIAELKTQLSEKDVAISERDEKIIQASESIKSLNDTIAEKDLVISELQPIKEAYEKEQAEKEEAECKKKRCAMKEKAISSTYVSEKDFEENEVLKTALSELDEKTIKAFIADRVIAEASKQVEEKQAISEVETTKEPTIDMSSVQEYNYASELENDPMANLIKSMQR